MAAAMTAIDAALARRLVAAQFPDWADLTVTPAQPQGWDNRSFRLGTDKVVRLPSSRAYADQVAKEQRWLPVLARALPLPIPVPLAEGRPTAEFAYPWSIYRWLEGAVATADNVRSLKDFATDLAGFLRALQGRPAVGGPEPGAHNFHRGGNLLVYDAETRAAASALRDRFDEAAVLDCWAAALASSWQHAPVWVHGDVAANNLLVRDGRLAAVIDFGSSAVGDPACDLVIAWTMLEGESRAAFRLALPHEADTWARARGWALWKALITVDHGLPEDAALHERVLREVLAEHGEAKVG